MQYSSLSSVRMPAVATAVYLSSVGSALTAQEAQGWLTFEPSVRLHHAMAYDGQRGRTVLFGGDDWNLGPYRGDTWEWDGGTWTHVSSDGPPPRRGHAMAHDSQRGRTVLFGGDSGSGLLGDTWEWDGGTWRQVSVGGPTPREHCAMVFDGRRGRTILFGGNGVGGLLGDTWEWDGSAWTQVSTGGPSPRHVHGMVYDSLRGQAVLFGGRLSVSSLGDTWAWNGSVWSQLSAAGPVYNDQGLAYDSRRDRIVFFSDGPFRNTWEWDGASWTQVGSGGPSHRNGQAMVYDGLRGRTLLFGGYSNNGRQNDTWEWDGAAWVQAGLLRPAPRERHAMAYDSLRGQTVLFGGDGAGGQLGDTWIWENTSWTQVSTGGPSARFGHAMVFDSRRRRLVLFGGQTAGPPDDETWEWDGSAWSQVGGAIRPPGRTWHAMAYDSLRGQTVLFGGWALGDTWEWDGSSWVQRSSSSAPAPRIGHAMAFDEQRGRTVLFGGRTTFTNCDTWEWDGVDWQWVAGSCSPSGSGPRDRHFHALVYDARRGGCVLFGGHSMSNFGLLNDTWIWDGNSWVEFTAGDAPRARSAHAMTYDAQRDRIVLFGGRAVEARSYLAETWELGWPGIARPFGSGCGSPPLTLSPVAGAGPVLNRTARVALTGIPFYVALVGAGWSNTTFGSWTLPHPLAGTNAPGCELLTSGEVVFAAVPTGHSTATLDVALPNVNDLVGLHVYLQAFAPAPAANAANVVASNGVEWIVGSR